MRSRSNSSTKLPPQPLPPKGESGKPRTPIPDRRKNSHSSKKQSEKPESSTPNLTNIFLNYIDKESLFPSNQGFKPFSPDAQ